MRIAVLVGGVGVGVTLAAAWPSVSRGDDDTLRLAPAADGGVAAPGGEGNEGYQGVAPGAPNLPPHPPRLPVKGPARLTWTGFQIREGRPTVFMELTQPVAWEVSDAAPNQLVYTLRQTRVPLSNNRRPLRAGEFGTVVRDVTIRPRGKDTEVVISLRQRAPHHERVEEAAGGFKLLVVSLGD